MKTLREEGRKGGRVEARKMVGEEGSSVDGWGGKVRERRLRSGREGAVKEFLGVWSKVGGGMVWR